MFNYVDLGVIVLIILCGYVGYQRGLVKEASELIGNVIITFLSFMFMGKLADIFIMNVPFLPLGLFGIKLSALNILVYELVAFFIIFLALKMVLNFILLLTGIVETIIDMLPIMSDITKIGGAVLGVISGYLFAFIILVVIQVPFASITMFQKANLANQIINNTPILSGYVAPINSAVDELYDLSLKAKKDNRKVYNVNYYNSKVLQLMIKYKFVSEESAKKLVDSGKITDSDKGTEYIKKMFANEG